MEAWAPIRHLHAQGYSVRRIARELHLSRQAAIRSPAKEDLSEHRNERPCKQRRTPVWGVLLQVSPEAGAMPGFETFEHTADIGLVARGRTLEELFANAAAGLVDLTVDPAGLGEQRRVEVTVSAEDREALLVAWLNELLFLLDTQDFLPCRIRIVGVSDTQLTADLTGDSIDPRRHRVRRMIKAATYHGLSLRRAGDLWEARMILDL